MDGWIIMDLTKQNILQRALNINTNGFLVIPPSRLVVGGAVFNSNMNLSDLIGTMEPSTTELMNRGIH